MTFQKPLPVTTTFIITAVRDYVLQNLEKDLTIQNLSKMAGLNQVTFKAAFKQTFGQTIHQYIIQQRLQKAVHLLQTTNKPMKEIAFLVGYSERNFYTLIQRYKGCSPHTLRCSPAETT